MSAPDLASPRAIAARAAVGRFTMPRTLTTERLKLVPLALRHFPAVERFFADAQASRFIGGPCGRGEAWRLFAAFAGQWRLHNFGHYALEDHDGRFLGYAGLWFPADKPEIEIGYSLVPDAQGAGFATEAVRAVRDVAIARGAPSLVSYIAPDNKASQAVAARLGARGGEAIDFGEEQLAHVWRYETPEGAREMVGEPVALEATAMPLTIKTARLTLTQWRPDHFPGYAAHMADAASMQYVGGVHSARKAWRTMASEAGQWALRGYGVYAVEAEGEFVGGAGLFHPAHWPERELAYEIFTAHRRKGFASEAAAAVREVAREQGLGRLVSFVHPDNRASIAVAQKLGCTLERDPGYAWDVSVYAHPMDITREQPSPLAA